MMTRDLDMDIEIIGAPTVQEPDGLAMSSRNAYLKSEQRPSALTLYKSLNHAQELLESGIKDAEKIIHFASDLITSYPEAEIDYISICDPETLVYMTTIDRPVLLALAVKVGKTRLIDNCLLKP